MSEARELFERFRDELFDMHAQFIENGQKEVAYVFSGVAAAAEAALAIHAQATLPDLPPHVTADCGGHTVHLGADPREYWLPPSLPPDDLDRIAEACRILAVRRRAATRT